MPSLSVPHPLRRAFAPPGRRSLAITILLAGVLVAGAVPGALGSKPSSLNSGAAAPTPGAEHAAGPRSGVAAIRRADAVAHVQVLATAEATATAPARAATASRPLPPPPPSWPTHNFLLSADGTLHTSVGLYTDCSGNTPLPGGEAAIDTCTHRVTYFVGHNVGVFTPLMHMGEGAVITWWDSTGTAHPLRVVSVRNWSHSPGFPEPTRSSVIAQFQTCVNPDGSVDRILDAQAA
jgi:hypothetical protein